MLDARNAGEEPARKMRHPGAPGANDVLSLWFQCYIIDPYRAIVVESCTVRST
jgi:hypothetical protein